MPKCMWICPLTSQPSGTYSHGIRSLDRQACSKALCPSLSLCAQLPCVGWPCAQAVPQCSQPSLVFPTSPASPGSQCAGAYQNLTWEPEDWQTGTCVQWRPVAAELLAPKDVCVEEEIFHAGPPWWNWRNAVILWWLYFRKTSWLPKELNDVYLEYRF